jgi:hypothetical protein
MKALDMKLDVEETFMMALCDWMENNEVDISKFPPRFKDALKSRNHIGWQQVFSGKLSQHWLQLQGNIQLEDGKVGNDCIWGASLVEFLLGKQIALWKLRNNKVYGIIEEIQETRRKKRLVHKVNSSPAIRDFRGACYVFFTSKIHAIKKMKKKAPLWRSDRWLISAQISTAFNVRRDRTNINLLHPIQSDH